MSTVAQWNKDGILGSTLPNTYGIGPFAPTAWDDLRVPLLSSNAGGLNPPTVAMFRDNGAGSDGVFAYDFTQAADRDLLFECQMPHAWKVGTTIYPHVHWSNKADESAISITVTSVSGNGATVTVTCSANHNLFTGANVVMAGWAGGTGVFNGTFSVVVTGLQTFTYSSTGNGTPTGGTLTAAPGVLWRMEYSMATIGGVYPTTTLIDAPGQITVGTPYKHILTSFSPITMVGMGISTMLSCRIYRNPGNAVDTYGSVASAFEVDFHYEIDSFGSDQAASKAF
jgi:hypothetical protein